MHDEETVPKHSAHGDAHTLPLIMANYKIPNLPPSVVERSAVRQRLEQGLALPITLLQTPAGYGKTTELVHFIQQRRLPTAWVTCDVTITETRHFWRYIAAALDSVLVRKITPSFELLVGQDPLPPGEILVTALINALQAVRGNLLIVLDDYHKLPTTLKDLHEGLAYFAEHLPPTVHLMLASRTEPPLPVVRWRSEGHLHHIRVPHLAFTLEHARTLRDSRHFKLNENHLQRLDASIEEWAAGWQLAGAALDAGMAVEQVVEVFDGMPRSVAQFLTDEALHGLDTTLVRFLEETALLDRLCVELCDVVTQQTQSAQFLEELITQQLFTTALERGDHIWYAYQHLWRATLMERTRDDPQRRSQIYRRASQWCLQQHLVIEAVKYALRVNDPDFLVEVVEQCVTEQMLLGCVVMIQNWLKAIPAALMRHHPRLLLAQVIVMLGNNQFDVAQHYLTMAEDAANEASDGTMAILGEIAVFRAIIGYWSSDAVVCQDMLDHAMKTLNETNPFYFVAMLYQGMLHLWLGAFGETISILQNLIAHIGEETSLTLHTLGVMYLANAHWFSGQSQEAERLYQEIETQDDFSFSFPLMWTYYTGRGLQCYARDQLELASDYFRAITNAGLSPVFKAIGRLGMANVFFAQGQPLAAQQMASGALPMEQPSEPEILLVLRAQQRLFWSRSRLIPADGLEVAGLERDLARPDLSPYYRAFLAITLAHLWMRQGQWAAALARLQAVREDALAHDWVLLRLLALLLEASIHHHLGDKEQAHSTLMAALEMGLWHDYIRLYWDYGYGDGGADLSELWRGLRASGDLAPEMDHFVQCVLAGYAATPVPPPHVMSPTPVVPIDGNGYLNTELSPRETEAIEYMEQGATTSEMAHAMGIKIGTVKHHINNVLIKLHADNRAQAITIWHALNITRDRKKTRPPQTP